MIDLFSPLPVFPLTIVYQLPAAKVGEDTNSPYYLFTAQIAFADARSLPCFLLLLSCFLISAKVGVPTNSSYCLFSAQFAFADARLLYSKSMRKA
ncbi:hypothetical protein [Mucilaginibacter paludis]|uniref:hypothetical protein n=1 Tax=Mucilaginibacter paludis TaxID=423351 RepID=UPI0002555A26|nr:hypothetical protein [Mucilaginibacter paludis]